MVPTLITRSTPIVMQGQNHLPEGVAGVSGTTAPVTDGATHTHTHPHKLGHWNWGERHLRGYGAHGLFYLEMKLG